VNEPFVVFDERDSGCVSYGIERDGVRVFEKVATTEAARRSLRRAIAFHAVVKHPAIVAPSAVIDAGHEVRLVYPWVDGEVLNHATVRGSDRAALERFHARPADEVVVAVDVVIDAHVTVAAAGFVSVDLYDGCFLYDFEAHSMRLVDLDEYRPAPFVLDGDRLPGSRRYMAPEEWQRGATIDEQTMVFHLGRTIHELLADAATDAQQAVAREAVRERPEARFQSVAALQRAWRAALPRP
jgi:hypothetical protein